MKPMSRRIALVALDSALPLSFGGEEWKEHLGFARLVPVLQSRGWDVCVFNNGVTGESFESLKRRVEEFDPDFVGLSPTVFNVKKVRALANWAHDQGKRVALGGHHATINAEEILASCPEVDVVFRGESEGLVSHFEDVLLTGKRRVTEMGSTGNLDSLMPAVHMDMDVLIARGMQPVAQIETSRGCYHRCSFCTTPDVFDGKWKARSIEGVLQEMDSLREHYGSHIRSWEFVDDVLFWGTPDSVERITRLARGLIERGNKIPAWAMTRADVISRTPRRILELLRDAGFRAILLGLESGSETTLSIFNKKGYLKYDDAMRKLKDVGIRVDIGIILWEPYSTLHEVKETLTFLYEHGELYRASYLRNVYHNLPGTSLSKRLKQDRLVPSDHAFDSSPYDYIFRTPLVGTYARILESIWMNRDVVETEQLLAQSYALSSELRTELNEMTYDFAIRALEVPDQAEAEFDRMFLERARLVHERSASQNLATRPIRNAAAETT